MVCEHLADLEQALLRSGAEPSYRGQTWTLDCREWVYFDVVLDIPALREQFDFAPCVRLHENTDPRSGLERGLECILCHDAVIGLVEGGNVFP